MNAPGSIPKRLWRGGWGIVVVLLLGGVAVEGHATEIMPWLGISRPVEGDDEAKLSGGLALRGDLLPFLQAEIAAGYRSETRVENQLTIRSWPITGSLYATPVAPFYAGVGLGWYQTTYDYASELPFEDQTEQEFGIHVGAGLKVPVSRSVHADLGGRYVMLQDQESPLVPGKFDPSFWMTTLGLAFRF